jgi:alkanesulfonate monooxygenase SsuD/methylene tetrahydromethanopterin reductase-like flavin-dependent oxidoreductase (luciferase family)
MVAVFANLRALHLKEPVPAYVARLESLGIAGVAEGDHLFNPFGPSHPAPESHLGMDQLTELTAFAAHSDRLIVASTAANVGFQHPALIIRRFAQMTELFGGGRVYAGFGAGWSRREFEALGLEMPRYADRMARLREALLLARKLFDEGHADMRGDHFAVRDLALAPWPVPPPRILVAGGSPGIMELTGQFADHIDLNAPAHPVIKPDPARRLITTTAQLESSVAAIRAAAAAAGRGQASITRSVIIDHVVWCSEAELPDAQRDLCRRVGLPEQPVLDCPFVLAGEPARMATRVSELTERLGLAWIIIPNAEAQRFSEQVMPRLPSSHG